MQLPGQAEALRPSTARAAPAPAARTSHAGVRPARCGGAARRGGRRGGHEEGCSSAQLSRPTSSAAGTPVASVVTGPAAAVRR